MKLQRKLSEINKLGSVDPTLDYTRVNTLGVTLIPILPNVEQQNILSKWVISLLASSATVKSIQYLKVIGNKRANASFLTSRDN